MNSGRPTQADDGRSRCRPSKHKRKDILSSRALNHGNPIPVISNRSRPTDIVFEVQSQFYWLLMCDRQALTVTSRQTDRQPDSVV